MASTAFTFKALERMNLHIHFRPWWSLMTLSHSQSVVLIDLSPDLNYSGPIVAFHPNESGVLRTRIPSPMLASNELLLFPLILS